MQRFFFYWLHLPVLVIYYARTHQDKLLTFEITGTYSSSAIVSKILSNSSQQLLRGTIVDARTIVISCSHSDKAVHYSLRKHAYSNILLPPKNENFQIQNSDNLHISAQNIDCGYSLEPPL